MILLIIACSLIGTVLLIGVCAPLSAVIPPTPPSDDTPSTVIVEPFREDRDFNSNREDIVSGDSIVENTNNSGSESSESTGKETIKADFRKRIASRSVAILRSRGMTDEGIKSELLRDFALTEEQVDEILAAQ